MTYGLWESTTSHNQSQGTFSIYFETAGSAGYLFLKSGGVSEIIYHGLFRPNIAGVRNYCQGVYQHDAQLYKMWPLAFGRRKRFVEAFVLHRGETLLDRDSKSPLRFVRALSSDIDRWGRELDLYKLPTPAERIRQPAGKFRL